MKSTAAESEAAMQQLIAVLPNAYEVANGEKDKQTRKNFRFSTRKFWKVTTESKFDRATGNNYGKNNQLNKRQGRMSKSIPLSNQQFNHSPKIPASRYQAGLLIIIMRPQASLADCYALK